MERQGPAFVSVGRDARFVRRRPGPHMGRTDCERTCLLSKTRVFVSHIVEFCLFVRGHHEVCRYEAALAGDGSRRVVDRGRRVMAVGRRGVHGDDDGVQAGQRDRHGE